MRYNLLDKVVLHVGRTKDVLSIVDSEYGLFDLIFIDGAHDLESAKEDMLIVIDHSPIGGIIALHDFHYKSVAQAAKEVLGWSDGDKEGTLVDSLYYRRL
jgi:predicted O-methyltransferase YrrM